jgi:tryptophan 2,3-dioxygenase
VTHKKTIEKDYSKSILNGNGGNDYEKYMGIPILLSLQKDESSMLHRFEMLFQIIHQSTELWLKLNNFELDGALLSLKHNRIQESVAYLNRASECINILINQLDILKHMTPWDFQLIRPALGNGSGLESPGWKIAQRMGKKISLEFDMYLKRNKINLVDVYKTNIYSDIFNISESLINWDENVSMWRTKHYKIAVRTIGHNTVGTKGTIVDKLVKLINYKYFPKLWELRSQLSNIS